LRSIVQIHERLKHNAVRTSGFTSSDHHTRTLGECRSDGMLLLLLMVVVVVVVIMHCCC